jgi:hypothetical protein
MRARRRGPHETMSRSNAKSCFMTNPEGHQSGQSRQSQGDDQRNPELAARHDVDRAVGDGAFGALAAEISNTRHDRFLVRRRLPHNAEARGPGALAASSSPEVVVASGAQKVVEEQTEIALLAIVEAHIKRGGGVGEGPHHGRAFGQAI